MSPHDDNRKPRLSSTPLQIVQDWYRTGDGDLLSPDIEWRVLDSFPSGGVYQGREAIIDRFFPAVKTNFASYETHPATFVADGETVITTGLYRVQDRSGVEVEADFAHIWTVRDNRIAAFRQIADTAAIRAVIGDGLKGQTPTASSITKTAEG